MCEVILRSMYIRTCIYIYIPVPWIVGALHSDNHIIWNRMAWSLPRQLSWLFFNSTFMWCVRWRLEMSYAYLVHMDEGCSDYLFVGFLWHTMHPFLGHLDAVLSGKPCCQYEPYWLNFSWTMYGIVTSTCWYVHWSHNIGIHWQIHVRYSISRECLPTRRQKHNKAATKIVGPPKKK